jgi:hypothetical protein
MILLNIYLYRFDEIRIAGRYKYVILVIVDKQETLIHYYHPQNFNNFFKKQVGESPRSFKSAL